MLHQRIGDQRQIATICCAPADERGEPRHDVGMATRMRQGLHLAIDSSAATNEQISDIIVTDISCKGLAVSGTSPLTAGNRATVEVPLIGQREVDIRWIAGNRAGCRFVTPLSDEELRMALCRNETLADLFPGLIGSLSPRQGGQA